MAVPAAMNIVDVLITSKLVSFFAVTTLSVLSSSSSESALASTNSCNRSGYCIETPDMHRKQLITHKTYSDVYFATHIY